MRNILSFPHHRLLPIIGLLAVLFSSSAALAGEKEFLILVKQWSEWGEFEKVVEKVPPYLDTVSSRLEKNTQAELHKHLGVAYYGIGKVDEARAHFILAHDLDPAVRLDKTYVSREILVFFMSTVEAQQRLKEQEAMRDSLVNYQKEQQAGRARLTNMESSRRRRRKRANLITAAGSFAVAGVCAGLAVRQYADTDAKYREFRGTANDGVGDLLLYEQQKDEVKRGDQLTMAAGGGALLFTATGTVFLVRFIRNLKLAGNRTQNPSESE